MPFKQLTACVCGALSMTSSKRKNNTDCPNIHCLQYLYSYSLKNTQVFDCRCLLYVTRHHTRSNILSVVCSLKKRRLISYILTCPISLHCIVLLRYFQQKMYLLKFRDLMENGLGWKKKNWASFSGPEKKQSFPLVYIPVSLYITIIFILESIFHIEYNIRNKFQL